MKENEKIVSKLSEEELSKVDGGRDEQGNYVCSQCGASFATREQLFKHKKTTGHI